MPHKPPVPLSLFKKKNSKIRKRKQRKMGDFVTARDLEGGEKKKKKNTFAVTLKKDGKWKG